MSNRLPQIGKDNLEKVLAYLKSQKTNAPVDYNFVKNAIDSVTPRVAQEVFINLEVLGFINKRRFPTPRWSRYINDSANTARDIIDDIPYFAVIHEVFGEPSSAKYQAIEDRLQVKFKIGKDSAERVRRCYEVFYAIGYSEDSSKIGIADDGHPIGQSSVVFRDEQPDYAEYSLSLSDPDVQDLLNKKGISHQRILTAKLSLKLKA